MSDARAEWVRRVLGVALGSGDAPTAAGGEKLLPDWTAAKDEVDAGIERLVAALRQVVDPDVLQIAEWGLQKHTDGRAVRLMAALRDADASGAAKDRARAAQAAGEFRAFLNGDAVVDLLENNPFGVPVPLRRSFGPVLDRVVAAGRA